MSETLSFELPSLGELSAQRIELTTTGSLAILGKSGAGKSTLLKILSGLAGKQRHGKYELFGYSWTAQSTDNPCVYVNSTFGLFANWSVQQNLSNTYKHCDSQYKRSVPALSLEQVVTDLNLTSLLDKQALSLSGGEMQRVLIARAMLSNKPIILLDEVLNSLDGNMKIFVMHKLIKWQKHFKRHFVVVSHQISDAAFLCQQALVVKSGSIIGFSSFESALLEYNTAPELFISTLQVEYSKTIATEAVHVYKLKNSDQTIYRKANPHELIEQQAFKRLQIAASQISLCLEQDINISTLNQLNGIVRGIDYLNSGVIVHLTVDEQSLQAYISVKSQKQMKLKQGQRVTALFKAV